MNEEKFLTGDCIDLRQRTEFAESVQRFLQKARMFFDAETAALVYPRALYIEVADRDEAFAPDGARREAERLSELLKNGKEPLRFQFKVFSGAHEFDKGNDGIQWFYTHLFDGKE